MRLFIHFYPLCRRLGGVLLMALAITGRSQTAAVSESQWQDSLSLINNILKDMAKTTGLAEQYELYLRAENTFQQIQKLLPIQKAKDTHKELGQAYNQLPPPPALVDELGLRFTYRQQAGGLFYWSDPVSEALFVDYLNDNQIPASECQKVFIMEKSKIKFNEEESRYLTRRPDLPVPGVNYLHAEHFATWLSRRTQNSYSLPVTSMITGKEDPAISGWTSNSWKEGDPFKKEAWEMFGDGFHTVFIHGKMVGEFPEACLPEVQLYMVATAKEGKKIYCQSLRQKLGKKTP